MNSNKLKLIYDISVLGMGTRSPTARTGVFRTIENLFEGFLEHPEISLSLNTNPQHLDATLEYLQLHGLIPEKNYEKRTHNQKKRGLLQEIFRTRPKPGISINDRLRLYSNELVKTDIFHSPWLPVPKSYKESKKTRNFITIHDLIPVLFPDFFTENNVNQFRKNLSSINREIWVICNSESTRNDLLNYHKELDPGKVFVTYWAASSLFHRVSDETVLKRVRQKYCIPESPYILTLATIEPRKNIMAVLRAFREFIMQEKIRNLNLVLVGTKGWKYQEIIDYIESSEELSSRVVFTGYIDDSDLAAVYSGAMAFVYPSFYEGFGLPPLEAMKCGVPVICSNTSSLPEVVGNAGLLTDPNDIEGIAESIGTLFNNADMRKRLSVNSIERSQKFSWENCIHQTIQCYISSAKDT